MTELPLAIMPPEERQLLLRLDVARQVYNACLGEGLKRLDLLRQSKRYQAARRMPRGLKRSAAATERTHAFQQASAAVGFREYDLHAYAAQFNHAWLGEHMDIRTIQKLATRAFKAAQQYSFGRRGRPRFKGRNQLDCVEGKDNAAGIRWRDGHVEWLGLKLRAIIDPGDPVVAHGLNSRVKYVLLVRRKLGSCNRFYVQLVCEGLPYRKPPKRPGEGVVGLDLGPSTIAAVGEETAFLEPFCAELKEVQSEIRRLQRKLDRQRRANNPDNFNPNGTTRKGARTWHTSARMRSTRDKIAESMRKQAAHRKSLHGQLVHRVLGIGNVVQLEKLSYLAFQRQFGRSVGMRAPGMFVAHLKRKAKSVGAEVVEFPTRSTRLSQVCHGCGKIERKPLSQRWHVCECGVVAQRDLYSAFLARCVEGERLDAGRAQAAWPDVETLLQAALSRIDQSASGRPLPSSFGLASGRRQSRSPVKAGVNAAEARDAVPAKVQDELGEPGRGCGIVRTPCLHAWGVSGSSSSRKSPARGENLADLVEVLPPSVSSFVELAPLTSEEPASDEAILRGKTIVGLLEREQQVIDMHEGGDPLEVDHRFADRAPAAPAPLSVGIGAGSAVQAHLHRSGQLLEAVETNIASARMACGIAHSVPDVFQEFADKEASPTHLVNMALQALHRVGCYDSDGWLIPITADLHCAEPETPADCSEVLNELAHGVTLATETSDLYEISQCDLPPAYRMAFALMGSADDYGEPDPYGYQEQQPALPLALATGLSLAGLIFPEGDPVPWPNSSPYWRALVFFDASSGNELVDLRAGTADVSWDQLDTLREQIVDAHHYLNSAVEFMRAVDCDDPVSALVAWAGHLRLDLRRALARTRSREEADARS